MPNDKNDVVWLDARHTLTIVELADQSGLSVTEVNELVECGVFAPSPEADAADKFSAEWLAVARAAARLRADLDLPTRGLGVTVRLLERIRALEAEVQSLRARMPGFRR